MLASNARRVLAPSLHHALTWKSWEGMSLLPLPLSKPHSMSEVFFHSMESSNPQLYMLFL